MGNVIMKAQQIAYGASNVEKALDDLKAPELIELNKRMAAIDEWKANVHEVTYTGSELTIDNALALPARSLITSINAIQDLHGYDHPWAGGAGKNKLLMTVSAIKAANTDGTWSGNVYTLNNTTFEILTDSANNVTGFKINTGSGGASAIAIFHISENVTLTSGDYIFNGCTDGSSDTYFINLRKAPDIDIRCYTGDKNFTYSESFTAANIAVLSGVSLTNKTVYPMIRLATESDASFAPYSNECPISGRTEARVDTENEDSSESAYAVIQLGTTVYGADINWDTGAMDVTDILETFDGSNDENWTRYNSGSASTYAMTIPTMLHHKFVQANDNIITNYLKALSTTETWGNYDTFITSNGNTNIITGIRDITTVEAWKTYLAGNPLQVCYELATPTTIQLTPTQLQMLKGYNRVTLADGYGEIELKALVLGGDN